MNKLQAHAVCVKPSNRFKANRKSLLMLAIGTALLSLPAYAVTLHWDGNDATPGAGASPAGSWTDAKWTLDPTGSIATGAYVAGSDVVFAAGNDATGAYTLTLDADKAVNSLTFEEGTVTIAVGSPTTGDIDLKGAGGIVTVATGAIASIQTRFLEAIPGSVAGELPAVITKLGGGVLDVGVPNGANGRLIAATSGSVVGEIRVNEGTLKLSRGTLGSNQDALDNNAKLIVIPGGVVDTNGRNETVHSVVLRGGIITNSDASNASEQPTAGFMGTLQNAGNGYFLESGTFDARLTGGMGWTKYTKGTVWMTKASSNSGLDADANQFQVDEGRIIFTGANHGGTAASIHVNDGGILAGDGPGLDGSGQYNGTVSRVKVHSGGMLAPGTTHNTTGMFLSKNAFESGGFTIEAGATLDIDIGGTAPRTGYDRMIVTAGDAIGGSFTPVTLGGNLQVGLVNNFDATPGDRFFILTQRPGFGLLATISPLTTTFAGLADGAEFFAGVEKFKISYFGDVNTDAFTGGVDIVLESVAPTVDAQWTGANNNTWSDNGNWTGGSPNGADQVANFAAAGASTPNVSIDGGGKTVAGVIFDSATSYTVGTNGGNALSFDVSIGTAGIRTSNGNHTIAAPVTLNDNLIIEVLNASDTLSLTGTVTATGRTISKAGDGTAQFENVRAAKLIVDAGTVKISAKGNANDASGTSIVDSLEVYDGSLDLTNNALVHNYSTLGTLQDELREMLRTGQITTSLGAGIHALGYADNAVLMRGSFGGETVGANTMLIGYTFKGDADLNGKVDTIDFNVLAGNFGADSGQVWIDGDFNYDGGIDSLDFNEFVAGYGNSMPAPSAALGSVVPEPTAAVLAAIPLTLCMRRRRK